MTTPQITHAEARIALMACGRTLDREFPNCHVVLREYIAQQAALDSASPQADARDAALEQAALLAIDLGCGRRIFAELAERIRALKGKL